MQMELKPVNVPTSTAHFVFVNATRRLINPPWSCPTIMRPLSPSASESCRSAFRIGSNA